MAAKVILFVEYGWLKLYPRKDEDKLLEYANAANTKILKKITDNDSNDVIVDRLSSFETSKALLSKRKSVTTEKVALSKEQAEEFSPKKKKRNSANKKSSEKATCGKPSLNESATTEIGKSFGDVQKKTKGEKGEVKKQNDSKTQRVITESVKNAAENALLSQFPSEKKSDDNKEKNSSNTRSEPEKKTRQKLDFSENETKQYQSGTSLTKTWALCTGNNSPPTPPADIIRFFRALGKPDVLSYISAFLQFYDASEAESTNSEEQRDGLWAEELSYVQMLPPLQNNQGSLHTTLSTQESSAPNVHESNLQKSTYQNTHSSDGSSQHLHQSNQLIDHIHMQTENQPHLTTYPLQDQTYTAHHADGLSPHVQHGTPQSATQQQVSNTFLGYSNVKSPQQEFQWSCTPPSLFQMHQSNTLENISQEQQSPSCFQFNTTHSATQQQFLNKQQSSSVIQTSQSSVQQSPVFNHSFNQPFNQTSNQSPQPQLSQPPESVRRSPRKHTTDVIGESPDLDGKVRLLAKHDVKVHHRLLRKATRAANNASTEKAGYKLTSKLICLLFSEQELALSCGQGIRTKKGDVRPSLDSERLEVLRDYVIAWCRKNNKGTPKDRDINDAITEQISYARKKCRNK